MFDKAISNIRHQLGIHTLADWKEIRPEWILKMENVGQATLDHIRMYLAMRNITLKDDSTCDYWLKNLADVRIAKTLSYDDLTVANQFTILIDSAEQMPFGFRNIAVDVSDTPGDLLKMVRIEEIDQNEIKYLVPTKFQSLGVAKGDYSIEGHKGHCNIERKSMNDAHGTILGWGDHRARFERELEMLSTMNTAAVVVECSFGELLAKAPSHGKKTSAENRKILHRQVLSWQQTYRIPWFFCDNRRMAEVTTFRILQRYWKKQIVLAKPTYSDIDIELASL